MKSIFAFILVLFAFSLGFAQNEQSPIVEKEINYKNWNYKSVATADEIDLRKFVAGKKLVVVVYFAPWCPNWKHDAPILERLYEKYRPAGLDIIGVGEYDPVAAMKTTIDTLKVTFPTVYESENRDQREKTLHHDYRTATGDTRKWGSPWYIFLEPGSIEKKGDTLTKKTHVINGEMIEVEGEKFIREKLALPAVDPKATTANAGEVEVCEPDKKSTDLKKP
jgi:thiol-disulfide isomerase/thioredoxin